MSQSPLENNSLQSMNRYRQGWKALNRLLHEDRSFSGNEKNCAFLNMRDGRFASISAVAGLDFNDDSRALAICDWDFDGKLDLWSSARTAPRVRLVRNQSPSSGHFVAIQLQGNGTTTNRDAIGARVEVITDKNDGKLIKTLHAGDGFLTQSSRWLHFGLADALSIKEIRVNWPGGKLASYAVTEIDRFYLISQSTPEVTAWQPPTSRKELVAKNQVVPKSPSSIRIVPPTRLPLPNLTVVDENAQTERLNMQGPTLAVVWSAHCPTCIGELTQWAKTSSEFKQRGLNLILLNADLMLEKTDFDERANLLANMKSPFPAYVATENAIRSLDYFQRSIMDRWQSMPVPCSFLVDKYQRVIAIYKGPVALDQILSDLKLIDETPEQIRMAGLPFAGRWGSPPPQADPTRVSSQMVDRTAVNEAIDYLQTFIDTSRRANEPISPLQLADAQYVRSVLLGAQGRIDEAQTSLEACKALNPRDYRVRSDLANIHLKQRNFGAAQVELETAVAINPDDLSLQRDLAICLLQQQKFQPAIDRFSAILKESPGDAVSQFHMATALRNVAKWSEAKAAYGEAIKDRKTFILAANNLAWILATHPDDQHRDGEQAVKLATQMCELTKYSQPEFLDTLAAALAESGQFDTAIKTIANAIELTRKKKGNDDGSLAKRLELYQQKKPYRESSWAK